MFIKILIPCIILIAIVFVGIGIRVLIKGKFIETSISKNKHLAKHNITCVKSDELKKYNKSKNGDNASNFSCCGNNCEPE